MDRLDFSTAYRIFEYLKNAVTSSSEGFKIFNEVTGNDFLVFEFSKSGLKLSIDKVYENEDLNDCECCFRIQISRNVISFEYFPLCNNLYKHEVSVDIDGNPKYKDINTKLRVADTLKEWNDNFGDYALAVEDFYNGREDPETNKFTDYLQIRFGVMWDFNTTDTLETFYDEVINKTMKTIESDNFKNFIKDKIFSLLNEKVDYPFDL